MTNVTVLRTRLAHALPFYYGWVIAGNGVAVSLSTRTVMAVATLSVFVVPMTQSMGWSVGMFSGAVSLGGLVAVFVSPIVGRWLDKYGAGVILGTGSFATGALAIGLAFVAHPLAFYILYVPGRVIFSGPMEMGLPRPSATGSSGGVRWDWPWTTSPRGLAWPSCPGRCS